MKKIVLFFISLAVTQLFAQNEPEIIKTPKTPEAQATKIFYSQKLINTKTVEVLSKGIMEFSVAHNFGDIAGDEGGTKNFFGLDNASDIRIGFQTGLSDRLNLILSRTRGYGVVRQQWELGLKYQFLKQLDNDPTHPVSITVFANNVISSQEAFSDSFLVLENSYKDFSDRMSQVVQVLIARRFGKVSVQLNPLYLHTAFVVPNDQEHMFALGGAIRVPISKKIVILADYFHPFRTESSKDFYASKNIKFYDPLGIGFEILTEGHVFHLNFTNSTEILENRFIRNTTKSWAKGEFRWAFILSRNFVLFRSKK